MNKCFITKLPSSVDNDNLPVLGQLRINWLKQSDLTNNNQRKIMLRTTDSITVTVSGAHLTDSTLANNLGNTKIITNNDGLVTLYVSNDSDAVLTIDNKYSLSSIGFGDNASTVYFDIDDIRYCTQLTEVTLVGTKVSGDISAVSNLTSLTKLVIHSTTQVTGDISVLSKLNNILYLDLSSTNVSGDISILSNFTNANYIFLSNVKVSGNISAVSNLTKLIKLSINNTQVTGDISALSKLTNLNGLSLFENSITGDMSKIPAQLNYISLGSNKANTSFTWTANGRQNATLLAMRPHVPFDTTSMDNMFIDQATCTLKADEHTYSKLIEVQGTRTSASDAAVAAIQNMGVTISGVTKQA